LVVEGGVVTRLDAPGLRALAVVIAYGLAAVSCAAVAQDAAAVAGSYCVAGVQEVGSCIRLSPDGKFEYFLAYGAYDENAEGTWKREKGEVIVSTPAYDKKPMFTFTRTQPNAGGGFDVIVEGKNGQSIAGVEVGVTCDGATKPAGMTQAEGFAVACKAPPNAIALGLGMFGVAPQSIDVPAAGAGADQAYVFAFDPGDLGRKRFVSVPLRIDGDALEMTYADTPVNDLKGRVFRYIRER
jgi:hypothetical protein